MRLIDADALEKILTDAITIQEKVSVVLGIEKDEGVQMELKAYRDILNGVKEQPTIPYDMKWNPDCEDCLPEGIDDCISCIRREEPDHY